MLVERRRSARSRTTPSCDAQKIIDVGGLQERQDPMYDQHRAREARGDGRSSARVREDVLLARERPGETAEQTRLQEMENMLMDAGKPSSVSPRDNHNDHIVVLDSLAPLMQAAVKGDLSALSNAGIYLQHWADHLSAAEAAGVDKKSLAPSEKELQSVAKQLGELQAHAQATLRPKRRASPRRPRRCRDRARRPRCRRLPRSARNARSPARGSRSRPGGRLNYAVPKKFRGTKPRGRRSIRTILDSFCPLSPASGSSTRFFCVARSPSRRTTSPSEPSESAVAGGLRGILHFRPLALHSHLHEALPPTAKI